MSAKAASTAKPGFKQKAANELIDFAFIALYLAVLFCALATYTMLLLRKYDVSNSALTYTFAIINALVIGKVILIGEMMKLGTRAEGRPLWQSVLLKSVIFGLFVFAFHILEEVVKRLIHHEPAGTVLHQFNLEELFARSIIIFIAFIPLFAFRELHRVLGEEKMHNIFFKHGAANASAEV
jgi:hypothetical protein